jgi:hypothetical protein
MQKYNICTTFCIIEIFFWENGTSHQPQRFSPQLPFIFIPQLSQSQVPLRKRSPRSKKSKLTISQSQAPLRKKFSGSKQSKQNIIPLKSSKSSPSPRKST